jgi:hypothetical protein
MGHSSYCCSQVRYLCHFNQVGVCIMAMSSTVEVSLTN